MRPFWYTWKMLNYAFANLDRALGNLEAVLKDAVTDEAGAFGAELDALVMRAYRGRMSVAVFTQQMDALLGEYIRAAYMAGLEQGGVEADEADAADRRAIRELHAAQYSYVDGFAEAVMAARSEDELRPRIDERVIMWSKSVRAAGNAGLNSAAANQVVIFSGKNGEENCATCAGLMGARHRRSWFVERGLVPGIPGNDNYDCKGFNCEHFLAAVGAPVRA